MAQQEEPMGELVTRTMAMPADTNPAGDIFGGWVLSQMDIAGGIFARKMARGRVVTVAVDAMTFHLPMLVGDVMCCYARVIKTGRSSLTIEITAWVIRQFDTERIKVTDGTFVYVAVDDNSNPRPWDVPCVGHNVRKQ